MKHLKVILYLLIIPLMTLFNSCDQAISTQDNSPPPNSQIQENKTLAKTTEKFSKLIPGRYIVVFKDQDEQRISEQAASQAVQKTNAVFSELNIDRDSLIHQYKYALKGFAAKLNPAQVTALEKDDRVEAVVQDVKYKAIQMIESSVDNSSYTMMSQTTPWGVNRVGGPLDGTGKKAWVLDTGIDLDHPDLNVDTHNSVSFVAGESADDGHGHGTHVAGTIAAKNNSIGVVGVATDAYVVSVKVCDYKGDCYTSDAKAGIDYVASHYSEGDVTNISLGWQISQESIDDHIDTPLSILEDAIETAANDGLLITLAAGGEDQHANNLSPARMNHPNIYTISAHNEYDYFAYPSNYGNPPIDFAAPGKDILSLWKNGGTNTISGTSMAAPHVAGILLATGQEPYTNKYVNNDPDSNTDPIASSEPFVGRPYVTGSVHNDHPKLDWSATTGAHEYEIHRKVGSSTGWGLWTTVSSTSYTDMMTTNPDLQVIPSLPNGPDGWVAYKVRAVHQDGFFSLFSSPVYFDLPDGGIVPHSTSSN